MRITAQGGWALAKYMCCPSGDRQARSYSAILKLRAAIWRGSRRWPIHVASLGSGQHCAARLQLRTQGRSGVQGSANDEPEDPADARES